MTARCLLAFALLALGACAVDEQKEIASYRDVLDAGADTPPAGVPERGLGVLDTMRLVNARYEPLSISGEDYLQSLIDIRRAAAAFLPTVALAPSYQWDENTGGRRNTAFNTPVDASIAVNPVRDAADVRRSEAAALQSRALLLDLQDNVLLDAARSHYEVIRAEQAVGVLKDSLAIQSERVNDARGRYEAGVVRPIDVSLTESQAAQTAVDLVSARNAVANGRSFLSFLTGEPLGEALVLDDLPAATGEDAGLDALWALAGANRQDIIAATHRIDAAKELVESAYGQYYPTVSLDLQVFLQRDSEPSDLDFASLIRVSLPLFSAGLIEADVRTALSVLRQAKLEEILTRRAARRDVEIAHDNMLFADERVAQLRVQERVAQEALEQAEGSYEAGLGTNLERLAAQDRLLSTQLQLVNAEFDRKIASLDLLRTTGRLHELIGLTRPAAPPVPPPEGAN
jgi:outer membrane protein TolC